MIPIYRTNNYLGEEPIGSLAMEENKLKFRFKTPVTRDKLFDIFGKAAIFITEWQDEDIIAGEIVSYAYMAG